MSETTETVEATETLEEIRFEDFLKVDLRVGTVLSAEAIPKTRNLLKLEVNFGTEQRTIVAGLADSYHPGALVNGQFLFVLNLPPREFKGKVVSRGMILAAKRSDGVAALLAPNGSVAPGSKLA